VSLALHAVGLLAFARTGPDRATFECARAEIRFEASAAASAANEQADVEFVELEPPPEAPPIEVFEPRLPLEAPPPEFAPPDEIPSPPDVAPFEELPANVIGIRRRPTPPVAVATPSSPTRSPSATPPPAHPAVAPAPPSVTSLGSVGAPAVERAVPDARNRRPAYPYEARSAGAQGVVVLLVDVDARGLVSQVEIERSSGHASLDAAGRDAVLGWTYRPARRDGVAVPCRIRQKVAFQLDG